MNEEKTMMIETCWGLIFKKGKHSLELRQGFRTFSEKINVKGLSNKFQWEINIFRIIGIL